MPPVTEQQLDLLRPYISGAPRDDGEVDMYCPIHNDSRRSAQLNIKKGLWRCHAGCGGGPVERLLDYEDLWISPEGRVPHGTSANVGLATPTLPLERLSNGRVRRWHRALARDASGSLGWLGRHRGINIETVRRFEIGWDVARSLYTIPIRSAAGRLWNVRRYDPNAGPDRRKIWGMRGRNTPRIYPANILIDAMRTREPVVIVEGEWDALLTIQEGFNAITRTGAAHVWKEEWNRYFTGMHVYLCHDMDNAGQYANRHIRHELLPLAWMVDPIQLPYEVTEKHGKDLSDYFMNGGSPGGFRTLMEETWSG